jgi:YD repeat-containing protein
MSRRIVTLTLLFMFLLTSTSSLHKINASPSNGSGSAQEQAKTHMERIVADASKAVTYDDAGRVTKTTITTSKNEKVDYGFKYDSQNRLQSLTRADGAQIGVEYDKAGQLQGFSFPDGRLTFIRDGAGQIIRIRRELKKTTSRHNSGGVQFVSASLALQDPEACRAAVRAAGYAAAAAAAICSAGPSVECALAVAGAAEMAYIAYRTCRSTDAMAEESAA